MRRTSMAIVVVLIVVLVGASGALAKKAPVDVSGETFTGAGKAKGKIKKYGSEKGPMSHTLEFGPQGGLAANQFRLALDDGSDVVEIPGTWSRDAKNKLVLTPNPAMLEEALEDLLWNIAGQSLPGVTLTVTSVKLKPKPKMSKKTGAKTMSLKVKFVFVVDATGPGGSVSLKTTITYKGK